MDQTDLDELTYLADGILAADTVAVPEAERFARVLAQLVIQLNDERERIDVLLAQLELNDVQTELREHVAAQLGHRL